jgi:hypothetical protein
MSKKGWFGPTVSFWLFGPEPETRTTAGKGPLPAGSVSVPLSGGEPTPTGISRTPAALVVVGVVVVTGAGGATVGGELPDG